MRRNDVTGGEIWKCEYGHTFGGARRTTIGAAWALSRQSAGAGAIKRARTLGEALWYLDVPLEEAGGVWEWRVWVGEPEKSWPSGRDILRELRKPGAGEDSVVYEEREGAHTLLDAAELLGADES